MAKFSKSDHWDSTPDSNDGTSGKSSTEQTRHNSNKRVNQPKEEKTENSSQFKFSYDPENGDIIITHPDGIKTDRIKGLKGKDGESVFAEWCRRKGIQKPTQKDWEDFLDSLKGEPGKVVNGKDGLSAYEEWKGRQPKGATEEELSYTAFIRSIAGEKGKDGYEGRDGKDGLSAFEVWKSIQPNGDKLTEKDFFDFLKGETGKNGHEGVDGKNGDTWKPYVSDDGILYFENTRTGERTKTVNVKGLQGPGADKGERGDTWEPYFPDDGKHQLYFKNQKGEILGPFDVVGATGKTGPQGPRGESAYQIWLNEGHTGDFHDFLLWVAEQAQKGEDGKDGDTFRPHVEKGHLFFISTKTGERIDGGCVIGPEGRPGETGQDGHNVTHKYGYKEIYDWTCPVQEINPHLLASSDDLASGGSAEKHMRETLNRIKNIRKQGEKKENRGSWIQEAFWWCSGADRRLLRMCPAEHSKYMGIGTVIFFTALMAMISSFFAISYVFGNADMSSDKWQTWVFSIAFAIMWGLMIFFLDRFITNTMYSDGKVTISWLELRSALPRILISIFLGIVISAPLELKIFEKEVELQVSSILETEAREKSKVFAEQANLSFNERLLPIDNAIKRLKEIQSKSETRIKEIQNGCPKENVVERSKWIDRNTGQLVGGGTRVTNQKDIDEYNKKWASTIDSLNRVSADYGAQIRDLESQRLNTELNRSSYIQTKEQELQERYKKSNSAGLFIRLKALHAIAFNEEKKDGYHPWTYGIIVNGSFNWGLGNPLLWFIVIFALLAIFTNPFMSSVTKPEADDMDEEDDNDEHNMTNKPSEKELRKKGMLVTYPWFAVVAFVCAICCNSFFNALPYYIFSAVGMIMMLFILIDVSPVFYKMMLADGQYEQYLHKEKSITQDLVRLNFAKSIAKVNESEIGRLAPMIFSKPYKKIKKILKGTKGKTSLEWMKDENGDDIRIVSQTIRESNEEVFTTVLGMKKAIIEASYQAWYRDMRDAIIGMHKPGGPGSPGGGNGSINGGPNGPNDPTNPNSPNDPNDPDNPSARARRETGHHTSGDEPFDEENYYGRTTGTSPEYDASSDDPHPGTPEDYLNEEDSHLNNPTDNTSDNVTIDDESDEDSLDNDSMNDSSSSEEDDEEDHDSETTDNTENAHPDADVESEVSDDDDDDDTINPK